MDRTFVRRHRILTVPLLAASSLLLLAEGCKTREMPLSEVALCQGGDRDGEVCSDVSGHTDCPPGRFAGAFCVAQSRVLYNRGDDLTPQLKAALTGQVLVDCGLKNGATGEAPCTCEAVNLQQSGAGILCFEPLATCPVGKVDCDGGAALDVDAKRDHSIGNCGFSDRAEICPPGVPPGSGDCDVYPCESPENPGPCVGNAECATQCDAYCAGLGAAYTRLDSACEGRCQGGSQAGRLCQFDVECPAGECAGGDPVSHEHHCNCECVAIAGAAAPPGGLACQMGLRVREEANFPCDGTDVRSTKDICVPLTTGAVTGTLQSPNLFRLDPPLQSGPVAGQPRSCSDYQAGRIEGGVLVGNFAMMDTFSSGDLEAEVTLTTVTESCPGNPDPELNQCDITWRVSPLLSDCNGPTDYQGDTWFQPAFNDSGWRNASFPHFIGAPMSDRFYRATFTVDDPGALPLFLFVISDDGARIFLNGSELAAGGGECHMFGCVNAGHCGASETVPPIPLPVVAGENLIAVHVSNANAGGRFSAAILATDEPQCGNGIIDAGEECDPTAPNGPLCIARDCGLPGTLEHCTCP